MSDNKREPGEIFRIEACRCRRCGGLLTSKEAIKHGMGRTCMMKAKAEKLARKPDPNQVVFEGFFDKEPEE